MYMIKKKQFLILRLLLKSLLTSKKELIQGKTMKNCLSK